MTTNVEPPRPGAVGGAAAAAGTAPSTTPTAGISKKEPIATFNIDEKLRQDELEAFKQAFDMFDKNSDGTISTKELHAAMRRAGQNPTEAEVQDMINEVDVDGSGYLEFPEFCMMMHKKLNEGDQENDLKEVFRVFGKDETGCITADELKFVLTHLPGKVTYKEIDEMIKTVDENGDGKINYQEFRVMIGAKPNLVEKKKKEKAAAMASSVKPDAK